MQNALVGYTEGKWAEYSYICNDIVEGESSYPNQSPLTKEHEITAQKAKRKEGKRN